MSKLYDLLSAMCGKIKKTDWNQNDPTAPDYVKNRPFYESDPEVKTVFSHEFNDTEPLCYEGEFMGILEEGKSYTVTLNNRSYSLVCKNNVDLTLGNASFWGIGEDTGEPFLIAENESFNAFAVELNQNYFEEFGSSTVLLEIKCSVQDVKKIDSKYLPDSAETTKGIISKTQVINLVRPFEPNNIYLENELTYGQIIKILDKTALPLLHLEPTNIFLEDGVHFLVTSSMISIGFKGIIVLTGFDLTYGSVNNIYLTFPLNENGSIEEDAILEDINASIRDYFLLYNEAKEKCYKVYMDDNGTLTQVEM